MDSGILDDIDWPRQKLPLWCTREIWSAALKNTIHNNTGKLHQKLGTWKQPADTCQYLWDKNTSICFHFKQGHWCGHKFVKVQRGYIHVEKEGNRSDEYQQNGCPITDMDIKENTLRFTLPAKFIKQEEKITTSSIYRKHIIFGDIWRPHNRFKESLRIEGMSHLALL
eukprot:15331808-Ditylum_brightwellii.AAC.2